MDKNRHFVSNNRIPRTRYVKMSGRIDTKCVCHRICHEDCDVGHDQDLKGCWCIDGDHCRVCGCHVSQHSHVGWKAEQFFEDLVEIDQGKKDKF